MKPQLRLGRLEALVAAACEDLGLKVGTGVAPSDADPRYRRFKSPYRFPPGSSALTGDALVAFNTMLAKRFATVADLHMQQAKCERVVHQIRITFETPEELVGKVAALDVWLCFRFGAYVKETVVVATSETPELDVIHSHS